MSRAFFRPTRQGRPADTRDASIARPIVKRTDGERVEAIEQVLIRGGRKVVTALPTSPRDGDEAILQTSAMATAGIEWHMHYDATLSKWIFLGGPAWLRSVATAETTSSATADNLATDGPTFASLLPAGVYRAQIHAKVANSTATVTRASVYIDNAGSDTVYPEGTLHASNYYLSLADEVEITVAASTTVKLQYASSASSSIQWSNRRLSFTPRYLDP